ncbi:MAG: lipid-A-disaccharide synthase N-terminal domain-containing protein, partial [Myxococcota bacterium]|nr:lipid-A-disaccharide synthase N-terminal domain-containing protein [Myxococcota bacterium]
SYVPVAFWYLSLLGSVILLIYAIHRREPVFALGYLPNFVVYTRNLVLLRRHGARRSPSRPPRSAAAAPPDGADDGNARSGR